MGLQGNQMNSLKPSGIFGTKFVDLAHNYFSAKHSDLDCKIVSKKDFKTSILGQEYLIA